MVSVKDEECHIDRDSDRNGCLGHNDRADLGQEREKNEGEWPGIKLVFGKMLS